MTISLNTSNPKDLYLLLSWLEQSTRHNLYILPLIVKHVSLNNANTIGKFWSAIDPVPVSIYTANCCYLIQRLNTANYKAFDWGRGSNVVPY